VPKADIVAQGYDLSLDRYQEVVHDERISAQSGEPEVGAGDVVEVARERRPRPS